MLKCDDLIISSQDTLRSAMERMTRNRKGVLFVCDKGNHLIGVLSDGDVRRVLLDDTLLVAHVSNAMNLDPLTARTIEEGVDIIGRLPVVAVPIVDVAGRIMGAVIKENHDVNILEWETLQQEYHALTSESLGALAIIPARGGSKRIPKKNLVVVAGKSLLAWTILAAKAAKHVGYVVVSTDDREIAEAARASGAKVPWLRPHDLAQDNSPTVDVVVHALEWAAQSLRPVPELAILLEPTAPLRLSTHIDQAVEMLGSTDADSVVSVCELPHLLNPDELLVIRDGLLHAYLSPRTLETRRLRGQQEPIYVQNGLVYAFRIRSVLEQRSLYGRKTIPLIISWEYFLDVDTPADLEFTDFKMRQLQARNFLCERPEDDSKRTY